MEYRSALEFLNSFINYERHTGYRYDARRFNLDRMRRILEKLGNPHLGRKAIHIAGTKGKGSTACMISSVLTDAGYKVALYTSPHLVTPRERFRINGEMIPEERFTRLVEEIQPVAEEMRHDEELGDLTFFELYTAMGFLWFSREEADVWVVETGLGGRLDATNVLRPILAVVTPIGFDHTHLLGDTLQAIAAEKAGIIKPGVPVICATQTEEAMEVIIERCDRVRAKLIRVDEVASVEMEASSPAGMRFSAEALGRRYENLFLPLLGRHQVHNALTALTAIESLGKRGMEIPPKAVRTGLARVKWPARIQVIREKPTVILDVAHNVDSIRALRQTLQEIFRYDEALVIFGASTDKDLEGMASELRRLTDTVIATGVPDNPRMLSPLELKAKFEGMFDRVLVSEEVLGALSTALSIAKPDDLICITGSFYHVGEFMRHIKP
jgi:dihydrofolate synthase/folylpolyglutamate synthase